MINGNEFDVVIIGGSYAGLSAAMALGRSLRQVLVIDSGRPCNAQTPHSHNFITHDGDTPAEIAQAARAQVMRYETVQFLSALVTNASKINDGFTVQTDTGEAFRTKKLVFATGLKDQFPDIPGFAECWGISVVHCPYCHGYEIKQTVTGILGNGDHGYEFAKLIHNLTKQLTIFTNGPAAFTADQQAKLQQHHISIISTPVSLIHHVNGQIERLELTDGSIHTLQALYARPALTQHCPLPEALGCELTEQGLLKTDTFQRTSVQGVYACGDNTSPWRSVSGSVASGTFTGAALNRDLVDESF